MFLKPWPNGPASSPKWTQVEHAQKLELGGQTVSSQVHASRKKRKFQDRLSSILLANNRLMDVTRLALTWVGWWPNGEKLASTCVQIWSRPKWAQVIASQRKCTQALAKRSRKLPEVFNLRQLASTCVSVWPGLKNLVRNILEARKKMPVKLPRNSNV